MAAILERLRQEYVVDPTVRVPDDCRDPVRYFLLEARRGPDYQFASAAVVLLLAVLFTGDPRFLPRSTMAVGSIAGMALIPQLLGHTALNHSLIYFPAGVVGASTLLEPVFAGALAWWLLAEPLTGSQCGGAVILLAGVGISLRLGKDTPATASE